MRCFFHRLPAVIAAGWLALSAGAADMPEPTAKGSLRIGEVLFTVRCFDGNWRNFTQESPAFTVTGRKTEASRFSLEAGFRHAGFPDGTFSETLERKSPGVYRYRAGFAFASPAKFNDIAFAAAALPVDRFAGRELVVNGKTKITLPASYREKSPAALFRGEATELRFPLADSKLVFRGKFGVLIQDDRAYGHDVYTLRLYFSPARGEVTRTSIDLEIETGRYRSTPLDLTAAANAGFSDETADDRKGGWTDQGSENDLSILPLGRQRWNGADFHIIDPKQNNGKSCIMLAGPYRHYFASDAVAGQKRPVQGDYLHLLHATAWPTPDKTVGTVEVAYTDGTASTVTVTGYDVGNWWGPVPRRSGEVVWTGENKKSEIGLYRSSHPIENKPVRSVTFRSTGVSVWGIVAASVGDGPLPRLGRQPHVIAAGAEWQPIDSARDIEKGSVLDFSARLDAPAGKYGPPVIRDGHFVFRDRPDKPVRFYGTNLCRSAQYLDKEQAERLADRMAAWGINAVRIHHHDNELVRKTSESSTELNPEALDRLDYLIACFKKRGIYITTDLYVSRMLVRGELTETPDKTAWQPTFKPLVFVLDSAMENWKRFARNWLTHVNPYTGLALKDDPALISLSLVNEDNIASTWNAAPYVADIYKQRFGEWKKRRGVTSGSADSNDPVFSAFLVDLYGRAYAEMERFLREELEINVPISDQNMLPKVLLSVMRDRYDFVAGQHLGDSAGGGRAGTDVPEPHLRQADDDHRIRLRRAECVPGRGGGPDRRLCRAAGVGRIVSVLLFALGRQRHLRRLQSARKLLQLLDRRRQGPVAENRAAALSRPRTCSGPARVCRPADRREESQLRGRISVRPRPARAHRESRHGHRAGRRKTLRELCGSARRRIRFSVRFRRLPGVPDLGGGKRASAAADGGRASPSRLA